MLGVRLRRMSHLRSTRRCCGAYALSVGGLLLTARYVRRALREAHSLAPGAIYRSLGQQLDIAESTLVTLHTLERFCGCGTSPLDYVQCPPCTLRQRLLSVCTHPERHTTSRQRDVIYGVSETLRAAGYLS